MQIKPETPFQNPLEIRSTVDSKVPYTRSDRASVFRSEQELKKLAEKIKEQLVIEITSDEEIGTEKLNKIIKQRQKLNEINTQIDNVKNKFLDIMPAKSSARLSDKEKNEIRSLYKSGLYTQENLATQYGVTQPAITAIING